MTYFWFCLRNSSLTFSDYSSSSRCCIILWLTFCFLHNLHFRYFWSSMLRSLSYLSVEFIFILYDKTYTSTGGILNSNFISIVVDVAVTSFDLSVRISLLLTLRNPSRYTSVFSVRKGVRSISVGVIVIIVIVFLFVYW